MTYTVAIRPRRQITLPRAFLEKLNLEVGDSVEVKLLGNKAEFVPKKQIALDALKEIQRLFKESGILEREVQESGRKIRSELNGTR